MHITVETSELLVQVFPALLIAILIEGRFVFTRKRAAWRVMASMVMRIVAVFSLATATFVCLWAVIADVEGAGVNIVVGIAFFGSFVGTLLMISDVVDRQLEESRLRMIAEDNELRAETAAAEARARR